jgi:hypothetical protein
MTSSGTWNFNLSNAEIVTSAYALCGIRRPALLAEHLIDARIQLNLLFSDWANEQPNLWEVSLVSVPLIQGQAVYSVDNQTIMILDAYISLVNSTTSDRLIFPISRTEYASYPNKTTQGSPTVFWLDRTNPNQTVTLWEVPNQTNFYTLNYYRVTQIQDANLAGGETPDLPYRWLNAVVTGLAAKLAKIYAPQLEDKREADALKAWNRAATQDVENVDLVIAPQMDNYYR